MVITVDLGVQYCDGAHEPGERVPHFASEGEATYTLVPPGDLHQELAWPPGTDEERAIGVAATMDYLAGVIASVIRDIPGAAYVDPATADPEE